MTVTLDIGAIAAIAGSILTIGTLVFAIAKPLRGLKRTFEGECRRNKYQDKQIAESIEQRQIMVISLLAIMEGLMQQGCNHNVTTQYKALNDYLNNRPFKADWYKEELQNAKHHSR